MTGRRTVLALTAFGLFLNAQTSPVIHVDTRVVLVEVSVTDAKGAPVSNLTKDDFTLLDDGKARVIDSMTTNPDYSADLRATRTVAFANAPALRTPARRGMALQGNPQKTGHSSAIILDEANTFFENAAEARANVNNVLGKLPPDERIALYVIVRRKGLVLLQDYTTDRALLKASLAKHFPTGMRPRAGGGDQPVPPYSVPPATAEEAYIMWRENSDQARYSVPGVSSRSRWPTSPAAKPSSG